ncbi:Ig-like domain-containing protein, partial [Helcococcus sueciensis]
TVKDPSKLPDGKTPGEHEVPVVVEYPDGTKDEVTVKVTVKDQKDNEKYEPETKPIEKDYGVPTKEDEVIGSVTIPGYPEDKEQPKITVKDPSKLPDGKTPGEHEVPVVVEYPDGTKDEVTVKVTVKDQKDNEKYEPETKPIEKDYGVPTKEDEVIGSVTIPGYPEDKEQPKITVKDPSKLPDGKTPGEHEVPVVVEYPDGTKDEVTVKVTVKEEPTPEYTDDDIIPYLPNEEEPTVGSDDKTIPSNYITVTFESESEEKGEVKVGEKQGIRVLAKVKPGTNLAGKAQAIAKEGYGFTVWTPELAEAQSEQPYVASFIKSGDKVNDGDPIPAGWSRVTVQQDDNSIIDGTVTKKTYAVAPNDKLSSDKFVDLTGKAKEGFENPRWYFNEDTEHTDNPSEVAITEDTTITAKASEVVIPEPGKSDKPEVNKVTEGDDKITGKGKPGSDIVVELLDGTNVPGKVDEDGNWEVEVPADKPLNKDDKIKVVQQEEEKDPSDPVEAEVNEKPMVVLTFKPNGGTWSDNTTDNKYVKSKVGSIVDILEAPTREGYRFLFWKGSEYQPGEKYEVEGPHEFEAQWEKLPEKSNKPEVDKITEGDDKITGKGEPESDIVVELPDGTKVPGKVDKDGNWEVEVPADKPLNKDDKIKVVQEEEGKYPSDPVEETVKEKPAPEKSNTPEVDKITEGDDKITGKGEPGSDIVVELPDGTKVPGKVDKDGNWEVEVPADKPLNKDDVIKVVQQEEGKDPSDPAEVTVTEKPETPTPEKSKTPTVDKITEGDKKITGKGEPGSDIEVELPDGTKIPGKVDKDGNWEIEIPADKSLKAKDKVKVVQKEQGKEISDTIEIIVNKKGVKKPGKVKPGKVNPRTGDAGIMLTSTITLLSAAAYVFTRKLKKED